MSRIRQYANLSSGDVIPYSIDGDFYIDQETDIESLERQINLNYVTPSFRIFVLYPDETINYEIPNDYIKVGGSYNENYQNGQRRTLSFTVYNKDGDFSPNINTLWAGTRLRLDVGISSMGETVWFVKGYFVITKANPSLTTNGQEVAITANDKFALFENATGRIEDTYEVPEGIEIEEIIRAILSTEMGDGTVFDPKEIIYHEKLKGKKTQVNITKNAGDTYGSILLELATQLSAEIFYNANGNLTLIPTNEVTGDRDKPTIYSFNADEGDLSQLNFDYDYNQIVNRIVVIGSSKNGGVYKAIAVNSDERSPLCYQRIGYRTGNIINDSNIYSDILAEERAEYELRQKLILKTTTTAATLFNPFLNINNLIAIDSEFFNLNHEKYLVQSISFGLDFSGQMNITFSNINNLSTDIEVYSNITPKKVPNVSIITDYFLPVGANVYNKKIKYFLTSDEKNWSEQPVGTVPLPTTYRENSVVYLYAVLDDRYYEPSGDKTQYWYDLGVIPGSDHERMYGIDMRGYEAPYVTSDGGIKVTDPYGNESGIYINQIYAISPIISVYFNKTVTIDSVSRDVVSVIGCTTDRKSASNNVLSRYGTLTECIEMPLTEDTELYYQPTSAYDDDRYYEEIKSIIGEVIYTVPLPYSGLTRDPNGYSNGAINVTYDDDVKKYKFKVVRPQSLGLENNNHFFLDTPLTKQKGQFKFKISASEQLARASIKKIYADYLDYDRGRLEHELIYNRDTDGVITSSWVKTLNIWNVFSEYTTESFGTVIVQTAYNDDSIDSRVKLYIESDNEGFVIESIRGEYYAPDSNRSILTSFKKPEQEYNTIEVAAPSRREHHNVTVKRGVGVKEIQGSFCDVNGNYHLFRLASDRRGLDYEGDDSITLTVPHDTYFEMSVCEPESGYTIPYEWQNYAAEITSNALVTPTSTGLHPVAYINGWSLHGTGEYDLSNIKFNIPGVEGYGYAYVSATKNTYISGSFYAKNTDEDYSFPYEFGRTLIPTTVEDASKSLNSNVTFGPARYVRVDEDWEPEQGQPQGEFWQAYLGAKAGTKTTLLHKCEYWSWGTKYEDVILYIYIIQESTAFEERS